MEEFLKEIGNIVLKTKRVITKGAEGNFKAKGFGSSHDFYGYREYMPGDDIRKIDWKAYLKTENLYIREFVQHKQMQINIFCDASASMDFGIPNKWSISQLISVGLSYIALNDFNRLNIYTIKDNITPLREELFGKKSFYEVIDPIYNLKPSGKVNFENLMSVGNLGNGINFIISDILCDDFSPLLSLLSCANREVVVIHLLSPQELKPDCDEELKLIDVETGRSLPIKFDKYASEVYEKKVKNFLEECKNICEQYNAKYVFCTTDMEPSDIIAKAAGVI